MRTRMVVGLLLILIGLGGLYLGIVGWTQRREVVDTSIVDVAVTERETSPLIAALGGIALVTGLVMLRSRRDRTPI